MDVVVAPRVLLDSGGRLRLNAQYYITKQINAALARVLQLVGVDVNAWWDQILFPSECVFRSGYIMLQCILQEQRPVM